MNQRHAATANNTGQCVPANKHKISGWGRWFILVPGMVFAFVPLYWMITSAFKSNSELGLVDPTLFPKHPTLQQFAAALSDGTLLTSMAHSAVIAIVTTAVVLLLGSASAYAVTQWRFPGVGGVLGLTLFTQLLPGSALLVPIYLMWAHLGWTGSFPGLTLVYCLLNLSVAVWMLIGFFRNIPIELTEAALTDGASRPRILWSIILPLARPALVSVGVITVLGCWGEFMFALVMLSSNSTTVTVRLAQIIGEHQPNIGPLMAACTLATLPPLIAFFLLQRQFVAGLTGGAVKD